MMFKAKYISYGKPGHKQLLSIWLNMKKRCYNSTSLSYKDYGGRGIKICDEWLNNYDNFYDWAMTNGFDPKLSRKECSIDRIDINGNYEPNNCRWVNWHIQSINRRKSSLNTTGYTGISYQPKNYTNKKWIVHITINYKRRYLGTYETQKEALEVRNKYIVDNDLGYPIQEYKGEIDLTEIKTDQTFRKSYTKIYKLWHHIKTDYKRLNIKICTEWENDFVAFYNWAINNGYNDTEKCILTRINPNIECCPENCKFTKNSNIYKRKGKNNKSGYIGIYKRNDSKNIVWYAVLTIEKKKINLGGFKTQKEALEVRNNYIIDNGLDYPIQEYKGEIGSVNKE